MPCNECHQTNKSFSTCVLGDDENLAPHPLNMSRYDRPTILLDKTFD